MEITNEIIISAGCPSKLAPFLLPYLIDTCNRYSINTPLRITSFLSQLSHESGGFFYTEELASGDAYDTRVDLGNTPDKDGDGALYKGRGCIQITGLSNYKSLSKDLCVDFVKNPKLLGAKNMNLASADQQKYSVLSAGWFWNKVKLNSYADKMDLKVSVLTEPNLSNYVTITKRINGGINGLDDRRIRFEKIRTVINKIV